MKWKLIWHSLKKGIRVDLYDREADPYNRVDRAEDHPEVVEELGQALVPFLAVDGITPPPVEEWVKRSRTAKRNDKRFRERMERLGGTLPEAPTPDPPETSEASPPQP